MHLKFNGVFGPQNRKVCRCFKSRRRTRRQPHGFGRFVSAANDYFSQVVAAQKEFYGLSAPEHSLQSAVIEVLNLARFIPGNQQKRLRILNPIVIQGHARYSFVGAEKGQYDAPGPHDFQEAFDHLVEQRRNEELKSIPDQSAVEVLFREVQDLVKETLSPAGHRLVFDEVTIAKALLHRSEYVFGRQPVAEISDIRDVRLAGAPHVKNGERLICAQRLEKLLGTAAVAGK